LVHCANAALDTGTGMIPQLASAISRTTLPPLKRFLRDVVWRRLPVSWSEAMLERYVGFRVPAACASAKLQPPFIVVGPLSQPSGLGRVARACYQAMDRAGLDVFAVDVTGLFLHDAHGPSFSFRDGRHLQGNGTIILHVGGGRVGWVLSLLGSRFVTGKHVLAHWFWETERAPENWRHACRYLHGICVNSHFVASAVVPIASGLPIYQVPYPMENTTGNACSRKHSGRFTVLTVFSFSSNFSRKNPVAVIKAFREAFGEDQSAELIVKYANASAWPEGETLMREAASGAANIQLIGKTLSDSEIDALFRCADIVVSLHRSEGLGLIVAEAMMLAVPVIATDWSATAELLDNETGYPVPYELVEIDDPQGNYQKDGRWAQPDIDVAAQLLQHIRNNPDEARQRAERASQRARDLFDPAQYARSIEKLSEPDQSTVHF
jgi:glycosyltransferase involved in cell wall biosynthesis